MLRTDREFRPRLFSLPVLGAALALLVLCGQPLFAEDPQPAGPAAGAPAATVAPDGQALLERYSAEALSESVLLRPRADNAAVRSIEIDLDGTVLVNGKPFDADELGAFLGEDGEHVAALARLDFDALRRALALPVEAVGPGGEATSPLPPELPPVPRAPERPRRFDRGSHDDRVSVGSSIRVGASETAGDVVCIGCSVEVAGEAYGDAVAVGGSVDIVGTVHGNAVAVGGGVDIGERGEVQQDATSVGGTVEVAEGGRILGQRSSIGVGGPMSGQWGRNWKFPFGVFGDFGRLLAAIFRTGVLVLLGVLAFLLLRPAVESAARRTREEPWKALLAGLAVQLFFFPVLIVVAVVLAISIIGIPLLALVPVAILALMIAALLGFTGLAQVVGGWVERRTHGKFSSEVLTVVVGLLAIQATSLVGRTISLPGHWLAFVGFSIVCLGFLIKYVAWTIGLGAMTLAGFGRDWRRAKPASVVVAEETGEAFEEKTEPGQELPPPPPA